ncbi:hypothetical protein EDD86DRAFT_212102 [Gorgonomyces haynaldii]|nr:hypothetical protein EDD86DRAFT_212102 [Gorgonomyces haynaldii]
MLLWALQVWCKNTFGRSQIPLFSNTTPQPIPELGLFPREWEVLGPFAHGSRETGVDPLSFYGGFESLVYSQDRFPSELADGGFVEWQKVQTNPDGTVGLTPTNIRWEFNMRPFGWTILHHLSYFRSVFTVQQAGVYLVQFDNVLSFKIDNYAHVGNVYGYSHCAQIAIYLEEGEHKIFVAAQMDVRIFGDKLPPTVYFKGVFHSINASESFGVVAYPQDTILPEMMDGKLITNFGSLTIKNAVVESLENYKQPKTMGFESGWKLVEGIVAKDKEGNQIPVEVLSLNGIKLAPGQVYPIPFEFGQEQISPEIQFLIQLRDIDSDTLFSVDLGLQTLKTRKWGEAYKITHLGYDYSIQYSMVKAPKMVCASEETKCPVVVALHGAGVDVSSEFWISAVNQQDFAWVLFPTGRTPWGFDWHGPSYRNVESSLDALRLMPGVPDIWKSSAEPDITKLIYMGHSNGGQGAWWFASHYPDRALAALPAAGYMKIQMYIPFYMHIGDSFADPVMRGILEASISENDVDLYASNMAGIPILARSGSDDTNVPPLHGRRLIRLINEWNNDPKTVSFVEDKGKGHWYDGVLADETAQSFLDRHLQPENNPGFRLPQFPDQFTISTLNPASTGSKGGIRILQLEVAFRLGIIHVERRKNRLILRTTNVRRFGFVQDERLKDITSWEIDGKAFDGSPAQAGPSYLNAQSGWEIAADLLWISRERHPSTYGPISAVFTQPFLIVLPSSPNSNLRLYRHCAQHILDSWYLFAKGGAQIVRDVDLHDGMAARYNLIVLGGSLDNYYTLRRSQGGAATLVRFLGSGGVQIGNQKYESPGTGSLFLAPSATRTRLCLIVHGIDELGLLRAVWSIPFRSGLQVPDYMVVGNQYGDPATGWTGEHRKSTLGAGGVLAAGFWNNTWEFDDRSGYVK